MVKKVEYFVDHSDIPRINKEPYRRIDPHSKSTKYEKVPIPDSYCVYLNKKNTKRQNRERSYRSKNKPRDYKKHPVPKSIKTHDKKIQTEKDVSKAVEKAVKKEVPKLVEASHKELVKIEKVHHAKDKPRDYKKHPIPKRLKKDEEKIKKDVEALGKDIKNLKIKRGVGRPPKSSYKKRGPKPKPKPKKEEPKPKRPVGRPPKSSYKKRGPKPKPKKEEPKPTKIMAKL